mgnify:FL=1
MKHFGTVLLSCIILSGCCSCNDRCFTNAYVLGESLDIVVRNGVIMQCYTSGSKENSACKNVEVTDCAGNLLVPTSNVKTLLESFTLEGKERFALSDIQGSMEKGVPADFLLINANGKDLDKGMFGRRDVLEAFIGGRSVFKKASVGEYASNREIAGRYDKSLAAKCANGIFVGSRDNGVISFKGIPYAAQPYDTLRWRAPQDAPSSDKVYEALHFAHSAMQSVGDDEMASLYEQGEDMLALNIWTAELKGKKPVMMYIHGGAFENGGGVDPLYNGQNIVMNHPEVVIVNINYRLNIFGYLNTSFFDDGDKYPSNGNLALMDQVQALKWIKQNISAFGGDPDNITIFGESAGAISVSLLSVSPYVKDVEKEIGSKLFHHVIAQSGSSNLVADIEETRPLAELVKEKLGVTTVAELEKIPLEDLARFHEENVDRVPCLPCCDGYIVPKEPFEAWRNGASAEYDILQGYNKDEMRYFIEVFNFNKDVYNLIMGEIPGYLADAVGTGEADPGYLKVASEYGGLIDSLYDGPDAEWRITEWASDVIFRAGQTYQAECHSGNGGKSYMYHFVYASPALGEMKCCHGAEVPFVFGAMDYPMCCGSDAERELSRRIQDIWVAFAKTGNPSVDGIDWPQYTSDTRLTVIIDGNDIRISEPGFEKERVELLHKMLETNLRYRKFKYLAPLLERVSDRLPDQLFLGVE